MKYGLQVYTVRDAINSDFEGTFEAIKKIGYEYVELSGLFDKNVAELKKFLDGLGLKVASIMFAPGEIENNIKNVIEVCGALDSRFVVCPYIGEEYRTVEGYEHLAQVLDLAAEKLRLSGITLAYHNHAFEFDKLSDGCCGYDILFDSTKSLCFEPDVYWLAFAGKDPLEMMRKLKGRMPLVHLKDMSADEARSFCEVGCGILTMKEIIAFAEKSNAEFAFVEQDSNWSISPIKSAETSFLNL